MTDETSLSIYELSLNVRVSWQAHSLSNAGSSSNRLLPRRQLLADGTETDACSGNIAKHHHAALLAEFFEVEGVPLCPACAERDGRRAAALIERKELKKLLGMPQILRCGICDAHGFLITAKNATADGDSDARERVSKHSPLEFSMALALPARHHQTTQLVTRSGDSKEAGQMLMKVPARSGDYAVHVRYKSVGIGVDTNKWNLIITDQAERIKRHRAILAALRDQMLSPVGAQTATMLPHLTGLQGIVVARCSVGRAPMYSALENDYMARLKALASETVRVYPFETIDEFCSVMDKLIKYSSPYVPVARRATYLLPKSRRSVAGRKARKA